MKTGDLKNLSLTEIVVALQTQNLKKQDFVVPSKFIKMKGSKLQVINRDKLNSLSDLLLQTGISFDDEDTLQKMELQVLDCCHNQIGSKLEIPKKYYDKMLPEKYHHLLDYNVTSWFQDKDTNFLLRTFIDKDEKTGVARAMIVNWI